MKSLEEQYYILFPDFDYCKQPHFFGFTARSGERSPHYRELSIEDGSVDFTIDEWSDYQSSHVNPLLFYPPSIMLHRSIVGNLTNECIYGGALFPSTLIDENKKRHTDYFLINIFTELDCWSRKKSTYESDESDDDVSMQTYRFDQEKLLAIKESERLIFKMGGVDRPLIFLHERVVKAFQSQNIQGYKTFKVTDYEFGVEFD